MTGEVASYHLVGTALLHQRGPAWNWWRARKMIDRKPRVDVPAIPSNQFGRSVNRVGAPADARGRPSRLHTLSFVSCNLRSPVTLLGGQLFTLLGVANIVHSRMTIVHGEVTPFSRET